MIDLAWWGPVGPSGIAYRPALTLVSDAIVEPLRICLLAVAFRRCLELFSARSHSPADEEFPDPLLLDDPIESAAEPSGQVRA